MATLELASSYGDVQPADRLARWTRTLCVLFFFSGFPALIYQLTWQRALFRIFGVNIESVTIVVTAFMLGLGLGSLVGGWLSSRRGLALLPLLAGIELATGTFGLASLAIFDRVSELAIGLPLISTAAATLALVIVPTLLMGATLPVLVAHLVRRSGQTGSAVGLLYYVNTLGAGAACLVCAAFLFPFLGMQGSVYVAAGINGLVAIGALVSYWRDGDSTAGPEPLAEASAAGRQILGLTAALVLAGAGGFVSLSFEIFFFRTISYATGSSATAFALTLGAFLIGLASGSRQAGRNCAALTPERVLRRAVVALIGASVLCLLFLPILNTLAWLCGSTLIGGAFLLVYLVARYWGSLLPYLVEFAVAADGSAGMRTALVYMANIGGAAAGSIITGFVLMDRLGLVEIAVVLVVASLACVMALVVILPTPRSEKIPQLSFAIGLTALAIVAVPRWSADVLANLQWKGAKDAGPIVDVVENRSGIITVAEGGIVFGNGMYDGRFNTDLKHDINGIVRPYGLSLFHPAPHDVLMVGLSSGSWGQVIANNPNVASLTIIEISPGYLNLIARTPAVASLLTNPRVTIVTDDGRRWLRANRERRFDAIVSNTTWHFRANVTNLLSVEFLELVRSHLKAGGIFFYNTTESDRVQRTACLVFPEGARFLNHMVVSDTPIRWDFGRWRHTLEIYRIDGVPVFDTSRDEDREQLDRLRSWQANLARHDNETRPIETCPDILARTTGERPVTDDNMGSEWRYSLGLN